MDAKPSLAHIEKICASCSREFLVHRYDQKRGRGIFCSVVCYQADRERVGIRHSRIQKERIARLLERIREITGYDGQ